MNPVVTSFFGWLLRASWQAAILTVLILGVQLALRRKLDGRWRYFLWLLVIARLALPLTPPSPVSLFNYVRMDRVVEKTAAVSPRPVAVKLEAAPEAETPRVVARPEPVVVSQSSPAPGWQVDWRQAVAFVWMAGALFCLLRAVAQNVLFYRRLRDAKAIDDPQVLELFQRCGGLLDVRRLPRVVETDAVRSPALYGLFRPLLLLPRGLAARFNAAELRHIFLHELAHVRRRDLLAQWFVTIFQALHWFNPVLWLAFRRMAGDREVACDELALAASGESEGRGYGETIVKLLENCAQGSALPGLVGILEDKTDVFRRIAMIARFRRGPRWSILGAAALAILAVVTLTSAQTARSTVDLVGHVQFTHGAAVKATVFIYEAGPKTGRSAFCPSCYPDCTKRAQTDEAGNFKIAALDGRLKFRVLVTGEGVQPKLIDKVDPASGALDVKVDALDLAGTPKDKLVRGRILDKAGAPIEGATIETSGFRTKDGGRRWGNVQDIDPLAVSDAQGNFVITARRDFDSLDLKVNARGFAPHNFTEVTGGGQRHELTLREGAEITGRVKFQGKLLANVTVGAVSEDRGVENFSGAFAVPTDAEGRFHFINLPPDRRYLVYGTMDSLKEYGGVTTHAVSVGADGSASDAGDLEVESAHRISGRVVLSDGKLLPAETRLLVSREGAWDSTEVDLPPDGSFNMAGIPSEAVDVSVRVDGYRPSSQNASLDQLNPYRLIGRVDRDVTNLTLLWERGESLKSHFDASANGLNLPENRPLEGAENASKHLGQRLMVMHVNDSKAGQPLARVEVTPGRVNEFGDTSWDAQHYFTGNDGGAAIYLGKDTRSAVFKFEAAGFLPAVAAVAADKTNCEVTLTRGEGPSGIVVGPEGRPVADASVLLTTPTPSGVAALEMNTAGFQAYDRPQALTKTDGDGKFSFAPELDMDSVVVATPEGFGIISVAALKTNRQITLKKWGSVKGEIRRAGKPSAHEALVLTFPGPSFQYNFYLSLRAVTDDNGAFALNQVPPGDFEVAEQQPMGVMANWRSDFTRAVSVGPGETMNILIDAGEKKSIPKEMLMGRGVDDGPATPVHGVVVLPDGKPAAGAPVGIKIQYQDLSIGDGELVAGIMNDSVTRADAQGAFTVPMRDSAMALFAVNEKGVARIGAADITNGMKVVLQPWAKVTGTLRLNGGPGGNQQISLRSSDEGFVGPAMYHLPCTTDSDGRFVFAHVPPGEMKLSRRIPTGTGGWMEGYIVDLTLAPGGATNVAWGGHGRPVTGKIVLNHAKGIPERAPLVVDIHSRYQFPGTNAGPGGYAAWRKSPEGKAYARAYRDYCASSSEDGAFTVDDVPPGTYQITYSYREMGGGRKRTKLFMSEDAEVVVPALADAAEGQPYDLGEVHPKIAEQTPPARPANAKNLKVGDVAPVFTAKSDGLDIHLADYRGKYVLLDVRIMLPGAEMEPLRKVNDTFGKDDRLVVLTLRQDADPSFVKGIKAKGATQWIIGDLDVMSMPDEYGLKDGQYPYLFLIDPEGRVVGSELHGDEIYSAVEKALKLPDAAKLGR